MARLPNFLVIGGMRCGSTSIYSYLREHPDVSMSREKETDYFSLGDLAEEDLAASVHPHRARTREQYLGMFATAGDATAVGEVSPTYLFYPRAAPRIREAIPEAKIVCILRNPVDRAYSHFGFFRKMNVEPIDDFESAVDAEAQRPISEFGIQFAYTQASLYAEALRRYTTRFPASNIHIELFDDFAADPVATMSRIYAFIGVRPDFVPDVHVKHNRSGRLESAALREMFTRPRRLRRLLQRNLPPRWTTRIGDLVMRPPSPLPRDLRARLGARFEEDLRSLEGLIDRDLSAWRAH